MSGDDVVLDADSFLMKGEILDSGTGWCGNPAKLVRRHMAQAEVCVQHVPDATVQNVPGVNRISTPHYYMPENPVAKPFYASFGFSKVGRGERQ